MKMNKILLVIMIIALIFPSIATTFSYAKENIISEQNENKNGEENIEEEDNSINQIPENNSINEENTIENSTTENKVENNEIKNNEVDVNEESKNEIETLTTQSNEISPITKTRAVNQIAVEEGTYYIRTKLNEEQVLDVAEQSTANSANVQTWKESDQKTKNQMFKIKRMDDGYYRIEALHSGKLLDVFGGKTENCTNVQQYEDNGTNSQKWQIIDAGNGYVSFVSVCNGLYLDIAGASTINGSNVQVYETNGTDSQKFKLDKISGTEEVKPIEVEEGTYYIRTKLNEEQVLDVAGQSTANSANVQTWKESDQKTKNQMFKIKKTSDGYYKIEALHSGKLLDVFGGKTENCTNVQQYEDNGTNSQKWQIVDAGNGYVSFISVCNGLYLDIAGASTTNGANVQVYETNGTDSQKFKLDKIEELVGTQTIADGTYMIKTWSNDDIGLDIESFSRENGANVQLWSESAVLSKNQRFIVSYQGDGYYEILAQHSGKSLNVAGNSMTNCANVEQYESNGSDSQRWIIKENEDGSYSIISKLNGLYMDVTSGNIANGTNIQLYESNGTDSQKFRFEKVERATCERTIDDGVYKISTALNTNMYFDIADGSYNNEARLQLWSKNVLQQQKFEITYNEEGYYEIKSANSGKVLDVKGGSNSNGTAIQQFESNETEYQKWIIQPVGNGYYYIMSRGAEAYLDVTGDNATEGTQIQIYDGDQSASQMFKFEETEIIGTNDIYNIATALGENEVLDIDLTSSNLQIWTLDEQSNNQKFELEYLEDGYYKIVCKETQQVLTVNSSNNVIQTEYNNLDSQKWKIRVAENGYYYIISKNTGLYLDVFGAISADGTNVQVYESNETNSQKFKFIVAKESEIGSDFSSLDESKYPGYKQALQQLKNRYPNWNIRVVYTGLDWNDVIDAEDQVVSGSPKSLIHEYYGNQSAEWRNGTEKYDVSQEYYRASRKAIEYMMDPRNSLEVAWIFQFQDLSSSTGTREEIARMVSGTFLDTDSIIDTIMSTAQEQGISPFHIVSRILQEQGNDGSGIMNGYEYLGRTVYNLFNINVSGDVSTGILAGARYAYERGWFTPEASIEGGTEFLKDNYIDNGQTTLYFQKYNVVSSPLYGNQYMTNIRGANDEGNIMYNSYNESGIVNSSFTFIIPVYENMPTTACPRPV